MFYAYVGLLATALVIVSLLLVMSVRLVVVRRRPPANEADGLGPDGAQRKGSSQSASASTTTATLLQHKKDAMQPGDMPEANLLDHDMEMTTPISIASISKDDDVSVRLICACFDCVNTALIFTCSKCAAHTRPARTPTWSRAV